jgi:hypothetical protein
MMKPTEQVNAWLHRVARSRITELFRKKTPESLKDDPAALAEDGESLLLEELVCGQKNRTSRNGVRESAIHRDFRFDFLNGHIHTTERSKNCPSPPHVPAPETDSPVGADLQSLGVGNCVCIRKQTLRVTRPCGTRALEGLRRPPTTVHLDA